MIIEWSNAFNLMWKTITGNIFEALHSFLYMETAVAKTLSLTKDAFMVFWSFQSCDLQQQMEFGFGYGVEDTHFSKHFKGAPPKLRISIWHFHGFTKLNQYL